MKKLLIAAITSLLISCSKEDVQKTYEVKIYCYSETADFTINYEDRDGIHEKEIKIQKYETSIIVNDYSNGLSITNNKQSKTDSLYIRAESGVKKVEDGYRFNGGTARIGIQLTQLK